MQKRFGILICLGLLLLAILPARGQFREEAFSQQYNDDADTLGRDSTDVMFSFKDYFGGLRHKKEAKIGTMFAGSTLFVGGQQVYNRQYWKLPVIYGGLAATAGLGIHYRHRYNDGGSDHDKLMSNLMFAGTGLIYWGALLDGVAFYPTDSPHLPGRATLYSILLPGLGQAYNGEYWKIPIYWGGLVASFHYYNLNNTNYLRYKRFYNEATDPESTTKPPIFADAALYYRDVFRRWRDYSIVAILGVYLLQIIDANVFAYMQDFDVSDDLSMHIAPAVITPETTYAMRHTPFSFAGKRRSRMPSLYHSRSPRFNPESGISERKYNAEGRAPRDAAFCCSQLYDANYLMPYFLLNLSTRPLVSTSFCFPVKKGWHLEQISTVMFCLVDPVSITLPQAQRMVVGW